MKMIERSKTVISVYKAMVHFSIISLGEYRALDLQQCTLPVVSDRTSRWG